MQTGLMSDLDRPGQRASFLDQKPQLGWVKRTDRLCCTILEKFYFPFSVGWASRFPYKIPIAAENEIDYF